MKFLSRFAGVLAIIFLSSSVLPAADTVDIQQHWVPGKRYYQTMRTEQSSKFEVGGQQVEQAVTVIAEMTMTVSPQVAGQPKRMVIRYERSAMDMNVNGQKMGFDSAKPNEGTDPLNFSKAMGATVGKELKLVLDDQDHVASIENYDEFVKDVGASPVPGIDPRKMFSKDALTQMLRQGSLQATPGKPVSVGESWPFKTEIELPQMGKVAVSGNYTYKGTSEHEGNKCAEIVTKGDMSLQMTDTGGKDSPIAQLGIQINDGTIKGSIWFDAELGIARDTELDQEISLAMKNPADATQQIVLPMVQHISVKLTKVEDVK